MQTTKTVIPTDVPLTLGQKLKRMRERAGMTIRELSAASGLSEGVISTSENDARPITAQTVALYTLVLLRNKPIDAAEFMWTAAKGMQISVERPADADLWYYELKPYADGAAPEDLETAKKVFKVATGDRLGIASMRSIRRKINAG